MATIAQQNMKVSVPTTVTTTSAAATGSTDTLVYNPGTYQMLEIRNTTGASVNCVIAGSAATTIAPDGYGGTISVASGKTIAVAANATVIVALDSIKSYLQGTITTANSGAAGALVYSLYAL